MINAWSLLYDEMNGTMDKTYPIKEDIMTEDKIEINTGTGNTIFNVPNPDGEDNRITSLESDEYDPIVGSGNTASASADTLNINIPAGFGAGDTISLDTTHLTGAMGDDYIDFGGFSGTVYDDFRYHDSEPTTIPVPEGIDTIVSGGGSKPEPDLGYKSQKYQEDVGIKDLKDYVSSTYRGHYTNKNSDTQTLDLIHSVGDAESFCRSNALKYLSRYDKKGTAKQDILKAMHYCLLLYYFSGNTKEPEYTNTRYETF